VQHYFGGHGSNYTKNRVIEESTLMEIYRNCHGNIERNFVLTALTDQHAPPDMIKTLAKMELYLRDHGPNKYRPGRSSAHPIPDTMDVGLSRIFAGSGNVHDGLVDLESGPVVEADDIGVELD
jgi:hypothetical protein